MAAWPRKKEGEPEGQSLSAHHSGKAGLSQPSIELVAGPRANINRPQLTGGRSKNLPT